MPQQIYGFGSFQLNVTERQLMCHASVIRLHAKVFDTLVVLIADAGRLLRKEALMRAIWPNVVVEENNLQHNICVLRRVLAQYDGQTFIETVPGQGYRFAAKVHLPELPMVPKSPPALLAMQRPTTPMAIRPRSVPQPARRWPAAPRSDAEQLAALSRRVDELRRCFRELARELAEVEQHLRQKGARDAGTVSGNFIHP